MPTRRQIVQWIAAAGLAGGPMARLAAQVRERLRSSDMQGALAAQGRELPDARIEAIRPALQQSLNETDAIRAFDVSDAVGLPVVFSPTRRSGR